jgi:hypothetical protein
VSPPSKAPTFVSLLEEIIVAAGGLSKLAAATGVSEATLRKWRKGGHPTDRLSELVEQVHVWAHNNMSGKYPPSNWPAGLPGFIGSSSDPSGTESKPTEPGTTHMPVPTIVPGQATTPDAEPRQAKRHEEIESTGPESTESELTGSELTGSELTGSELELAARRHWKAIVGALVLLAAMIVGGAWLLMPRSAAVPEESSVVPGGRTIVVQNMVAFGPSSLEEDRSPSYLASRPVAHCADMPGCKLDGTDVTTGDTLQAVCQLQGELLTNADVESPGVKANPNVAGSALWYGAMWRDGRRGFISEVYVKPTYRGGLGLPPC